MLSTKVGRVYAPAPDGVRNAEGYVGGLPFEGRFDYSYDGALRSLEQSLLRLGTARVDVALIHDIDAWTHGAEAVEARYREALDGAWRALADLRAQGVVRAIGVGVNDAAICARVARDADPDCVLLAGRYSLLEQPALDDFLPLAQAQGIGVLLGGVFNSGILATGAIAGARYNYRAAPPDDPRPRARGSSASARRTASSCRTPRSPSRSAIRPSRRSCWGPSPRTR